MLMDNARAVDVDDLRARCEGMVAAPGDQAYDEVRRAWNLAVDQRPALVAVPESVADIVAVVGFARERGMRVAPQGTGHNAAPIASLEDTVLVKTSALREVEIDVAGRRARVGAGVLWAEVTGPASEHGLAPLAGSSPDVGVVGYTLGGGLSWLGAAPRARRQQRARDRARHGRGPRRARRPRQRARAVLGPARRRRQLRRSSPRWSSSSTRRPRSTPGMMLWPWERAGEVLRAYVDWCRTAPDAISTSARLLQVPPLPDIPEPVRGRQFVAIDGAYLGDAAAARGRARPRCARSSRRSTRSRRSPPPR